jgi:prefoldin subunit 5
MFWKKSHTETHEEFIETVQLLDSEVEELNAQIAALNGHYIEMIDRRCNGVKFVKLDRRKK